MAALVQWTPAREIATCEFSTGVVECECEITGEERVAEAIDALCAVAIDA